MFRYLLLLFLTSLATACGGGGGAAAPDAPQNPDEPTPSAGLAVTASALSRPTPLIGYNGRTWGSSMSATDFTDADFTAAAATVAPHVLRYPAGTFGNYWDWQAGTVDGSLGGAPSVPPDLLYRPEELRLGTDAMGAQVVFNLNVVERSIEDQLAMLTHWRDTLSRPVDRVELGNEFNLASGEAWFENASDYATAMGPWITAVRGAFPTARIALIGANSRFGGGGRDAWNDAVLSGASGFDALTFHFYTSTDIGANGVDPDEAFSVTLADLAAARVSQGMDATPAELELWATEYNLRFSRSGAVNHTWTQALAVGLINNAFLENPRVTILCNHTLGGAAFGAIDPDDLHVRADGVGMRLLCEASRGTTTATMLAFESNPTHTMNGTSWNSLHGWSFSDGLTTGGIIYNHSVEAITLDVQSIAATGLDYDSYAADPAFIVRGLDSLTHTAGSGATTLTVPPYSITVFRH